MNSIQTKENFTITHKLSFEYSFVEKLILERNLHSLIKIYFVQVGSFQILPWTLNFERKQF